MKVPSYRTLLVLYPCTTVWNLMSALLINPSVFISFICYKKLHGVHLRWVDMSGSEIIYSLLPWSWFKIACLTKAIYSKYWFNQPLGGSITKAHKKNYRYNSFVIHQKLTNSHSCAILQQLSQSAYAVEGGDNRAEMSY